MDTLLRNDQWMPLASQQLRLRHLIRIIGLNIECRYKSKLYFTLHHSFDCPAFYRSADIQHNANSKTILWDRIACPDILKSNAKAVWVRVWEQRNTKTPMTDDTIIFVWHVWFSGLILAGTGADPKHFSNTLIFQLNKNCFSSPEHFSSFFDYNEYLYDNVRNSLDLSLDMNGIRCIATQRTRRSIRQSYSLDKLLQIQKIHRSCKHFKKDVHDITEQIVNQNFRPKSTLSKNRSSIQYLLSDVNEVKPEEKLECKELKRKIEQLRFKCNLLEKEHETATENNKELTKLLSNTKALNRDQSDSIQERSSKLAEDESLLYEKKKVVHRCVKTKRELECLINKRLGLLGCELKHIYPINEPSNGYFTVCNLPFPDKNYPSSNPPTGHSKLITPATLSVALGFVAHFVEITAIILDKPLRFPQKNKPTIPSKQILYGIYLLNYNIAQLNYDVFQFTYESRQEIIHNFLKLFCSLIKMATIDEDDVVDNGSIESEIKILQAINRTADVPKARTSNQLIGYLQVDHNMPSRRRKTASGTEDKRYHSEDNLETLAEHCLKHSYSHERLGKE